MRNCKKAALLLVEILCLTMLSGCIKVDINMKVNEDLTGTMTMKELLDVSTWASMGTDVDDMLSETVLQYDEGDVEYITETIDGAEWKGVKITMD